MDLSNQVRAFLEDISLGDLVNRQEVKQVSQKQQARSQKRDRQDDGILASNS
jgi:Rrf2 family iron-sulfur cluster assembly transcriptional regulator